MKGALWGSAIMGALGLATSSIVSSDGVYNFSGPNIDTGVTRAEYIGGAFFDGALFGSIIGALVKAEKWNTVALHPTVTHGSTGVRVGLSFR
jgi:hypothetical protein